MFTVLNRDVILQTCVIFLLFFFIFDYSLYAGGHNNSYHPINDQRDNVMSYNSYEDYLPHGTSSINEKKSHSRNHRTEAPRQKSKKTIRSVQASCRHKGPIRYTVRKGDTLFSIAKKNGVTVSSLATYNRITNHNSIKKGMEIKIPVGVNAARGTTPSANIARHPSDRNDKPKFRWPLKNIVTFKHDNIDGVKPIGIIITGKAGSRVISSAPGVVQKIGRMRGFGNYIVIHHAGRYATVYANVTDITVSVGDTLPAGNVIGTINPENRKLHFQIDLGGKPENPLNYLPKNI